MKEARGEGTLCRELVICVEWADELIRDERRPEMDASRTVLSCVFRFSIVVGEGTGGLFFL